MNHTVPPTQKSPSAIVMPCIPNSLVNSIKKLLCKAGENCISQVAKRHPPQLWFNTGISRYWHCDNYYEKCQWKMIGCKKCNYLSLRQPRITGMSFNILVTPHAYMWTLLGEWQQHNKSRRACGIIQTPLLLLMGLFDQRGSAQLHCGSCLTFTSVFAGEWRLSEAAQVLGGSESFVPRVGSRHAKRGPFCLLPGGGFPESTCHCSHVKPCHGSSLWANAWQGMGQWNWGGGSGVRWVGSQELPATWSLTNMHVLQYAADVPGADQQCNMG